ncbi:glycosyltransferase [Robertmurraya sp. GLU-23]
MRLSTITPIYNNEKHLEQCLKSLINCNRDGLEVEHIFVNDGSVDNSLVILKNFVKDNSYVNIRIINKDINQGIAAAYRDAFNIASGEVLVFLDADDIAHPDRLLSIANTFRKDCNIGFVYHGLELIDYRGKSFNLSLKLPQYINNDNLFYYLFRRNYFTGSALAIRNFEWLKSDLDIICCDYYFCLQIVQKGYKFLYIDADLIKYRIHQNNSSRNSERMFASFSMVHSLYSYEYLKKRWNQEGHLKGDIYSNLGIMEYYYKKDYHNSYKYFLEAQKYDTKDVYTYFYLGCLYFNNSKYDFALYEFKKVCSIDQNCFQAIHNIGVIYATKYKEKAMALKLLSKARKMQPYYLLIDKNINYVEKDNFTELKIIPVLTDEDNILMTYCKLRT